MWEDGADCRKKKSTDKALVAKDSTGDDYEEESDDDEVAYVTTLERVLFSRDDVLLDGQASVNVFCNRELLSNVRESTTKVILKGVQAKASGVTINQEGEFRDVGTCYFSKEATANILSYAVMVDGGNDVEYDKPNDCFTLRPSGSNMIYSFCRKKIPGSEGKFYCCDVKTMARNSPTTYPTDHALIETVQGNIAKYTKREVAGADKARLLLGKMGFPSVRNAIDIAVRGTNFDVTARDFAVAEDIYGTDMATMKGKTKKQSTAIADISTGAAIAQVEQILSVDVMFVEGVPSLIGLATPLDLTMAVTLSSYDSAQGPRSAIVVKKGIDGFVSTLTSRNFVTRVIVSDGEGAVKKTKEDLNLLGIEVDISGAGV